MAEAAILKRLSNGREPDSSIRSSYNASRIQTLLCESEAGRQGFVAARIKTVCMVSVPTHQRAFGNAIAPDGGIVAKRILIRLAPERIAVGDSMSIKCAP
jgi:hypothetical protein